MDPSIFGLDGHPFETESPRPDDTVLFEAQASLLAELRAGLKTPQGILVLVGESGMGKSALVSGLAERLGEATVHAYLPECGPGLRGVLTEAIEQLSAANGSEVGQAGDKHLAGTVRDMAKANAAKGKSTLIVIDDAHLLPAKTIERLAQMFPKDPAAPSRLHLLLVGRPELLDRINAAGDRSVLRYLVQVCRMDRIGPEDSFRYIAERITRAGGTVEKVFNEDALSSIVQEAGGLPARLNTLCKTALEHAAADARVLDMGTGSGALLLAFLHERPSATGIGIDASAQALAVAQRNSAALGLAERAQFREASWLDSGWADALGRFDLVLCNPPYVETGARLDPDVRDYEPASALFAGPEGLDDYRAIIPQLGKLLAPGGVAVLEIGAAQGQAVRALASESGYTVALRRDIGGRDRALILT